MVAVNLGLTNITVLVDFNRSQVRSLPIPNPAERLKAFGCDVYEVDGHDVSQLTSALQAPAPGVKAIVANTIKGFGCPTLEENMFEWHRKSPDEKQYDDLLLELDGRSVAA
jgi:transketolase